MKIVAQLYDVEDDYYDHISALYELDNKYRYGEVYKGFWLKGFADAKKEGE